MNKKCHQANIGHVTMIDLECPQGKRRICHIDGLECNKRNLEHDQSDLKCD